MASAIDYVIYACEQMGTSGEISYKKMFGEYAIYCDGKVIGLICDNQVYIKPTPVADKLMPNADRQPPYKGAKPHIVLEDLDDREGLVAFITATVAELPIPKPKKKSSVQTRLQYNDKTPTKHSRGFYISF